MTTQVRRGATIIDGRALASGVRADTAARVAAMKATGVPVRLDAVLVDTGEAGGGARVYAESQGRTCAELGIEYRLHTLGSGATADDVMGRVMVLSGRDDVSAIMVHLPLPHGVDTFEVQRCIDPDKDVEGVNPANIGNIVCGRWSLAPCTALAVVTMVESTGIDLRGKKVVIIGAGDVVGKPIAVLMMRREATVISCNIHTRDVPELARSADVVVAAAGVAGLVKAEWVRPGAVVIDVGVNVVAGPDGKKRTVGDVDFDRVKDVAGWISPVPGGVGPVTVAMLLKNVADAAERAAGWLRRS